MLPDTPSALSGSSASARRRALPPQRLRQPALIEHDLVDEYVLMIEPILLGGGKTIFPSSGTGARSSRLGRAGGHRP